MMHRHLNTTEWNLMTIESLFDDGELEDWKEFARALQRSRALACDTLQVSRGPVDEGAAALAKSLVFRFHPDLRDPA